jgi:hypothetical protein
MPDWEALKTEYITTNTSYRKLAAKYGISSVTLSNHGTAEKWVEAKRQFKNKVMAKAIGNAQAREVKKLSRLRSAADQMAGVIDNVFKDTQQFNRHIVQTRDGDQWDAAERVYEKADAKAIKDLASAIKDLTAAMRNLYDLPTITEKAGMEMAKERLEFDKQKAALNEMDDEGTGVIVLPSVEAENPNAPCVDVTEADNAN